MGGLHLPYYRSSQSESYNDRTNPWLRVYYGANWLSLEMNDEREKFGSFSESPRYLEAEFCIDHLGHLKARRNEILIMLTLAHVQTACYINLKHESPESDAIIIIIIIIIP